MRSIIATAIAVALAGCGQETCGEFDAPALSDEYKAIAPTLPKLLASDANGDDDIVSCDPSYLGQGMVEGKLTIVVGAWCDYNDPGGGGYYPAVATISGEGSDAEVESVDIDTSVTTNEKWIAEHVPSAQRDAVRCNEDGSKA